MEGEQEHAERRAGDRRSARRGTTVICRRGTLGLGPNIARVLVDVSVDGVGIVLTAKLSAGEEVELELTGYGRSRRLKVVGTIRWCEPTGAEEFLAGVQFRHRLSYADFAHLI